MPALSLDDAKTQLAVTDTSYDDELQSYVDAVNSVVTSYVGPIDDIEVTERWGGGGQTVCLRTTPVVEVTEVARISDGSELVAVADLDVDAVTGAVRLTTRLRWPECRMRITYMAGRGGATPASAGIAARMIMQHLWETKRGSDPRRADIAGDMEMVSTPGFTFSVPRRAVELLLPHSAPAVA